MAQFENRQHIAACMAADPHKVVALLEQYVDGLALGSIETDLTPELTAADTKRIYQEIEKLGKLVGAVALTEIATEELENIAAEEAQPGEVVIP